MRSIALGPDRRLSVQEGPTPEPGAGEVRVDVAYSGICGSDLHAVYDQDPVAAGQVLGHEFSGRVARLGPGVTGWTVGERVTVLPIDACGECAACGREDGVCLAGLFLGPGLGRPGGFAESVVVPDRMLVRLPDEVDDRAGALVEPLAVGYRAARHTGAGPGARVLVLGAGPVGLLTVIGLRARGVESIALVESNPARRAVAEALDLGVAAVGDAASAADLLGGPADAAVDATGHPSAPGSAFPVLRSGGTLVVVGICMVPAPLDLLTLATSELVVRGSLAYSRADFAEAVRMLASGSVPVDRIVTAVAALDEAGEIVEDLHGGRSQHVKVLLAVGS
ncbi:alcohol dehydrogenase catalytic domain-containing protein [Pseudonocardia sp. NPDC049154]|uniref:zinc-dependent alcohol dehydrogenase n=1 Tax=Pseudonocardia sp. NPDC049154 TaxID=3155501 RepID=UPI00340E2A92